jgi:hypothetical protein
VLWCCAVQLFELSLISFLHRAVCFEITLYLSSHFSYSSADNSLSIVCHVLVFVSDIIVSDIVGLFHSPTRLLLP